MACGVPVVVTDSGGLTESVINGETGFIISKDEERLPAELAHRLVKLLGDETLTQELGRNGRKRAEDMF